MALIRSVIFVLGLLVVEKRFGLSLIQGTKFGNMFDYIHPCNYKDKSCLQESATKFLPHFIAGDPALGIPSSDPLQVDEVNGDIGELFLKFNNVTVVGLSRALIKDIERPTDSTGKLTIESPIKITGQFVMKGKLATIEIYGDGPFTIETENMKLFFSTFMKKVVGKDGVEHYKITKFDYEFDPIEKVFFSFPGIYNGDAAKAKPIKDLLDSGWREMVSSLGGPVISGLVTKAVNCVDKFYAAAPANQIELP